MSQREVRLPHHVVDLNSDELRRTTGEHVDLRPRSFSVLRLLAENAGQVVTKEALFKGVWNDACVTDDSLTQCVTDIRKAIEDADRRILRTVPRKGYMLVSDHRRSELSGRTPDRPTLAVLPFSALCGQDVLGVGVASEIINELARNKDLRLIARDSSFAMGGRGLTARELGEQLGARYLVEGTIKRSSGSFDVDVQLVDALDDSIAWGERFSAAAGNIHQIQREIATKIASSIHAGMRAAAKQAMLSDGPRDLEVYELTLRGIAHKHEFSAEGTRAGRTYLLEAIRRDPKYAPAWAYLAWVNLIDTLLQLTGDRPYSQLGEVIEQFGRALELDPYIPTAYIGLSQALVYADEVPQAVSMARRGVELGPSDSEGSIFLASALLEADALEEALEIAQEAMDRNPLKPPHFRFYYGMVLWANERYEDALEQLEECLQMAPNFGSAEFYRVMTLVGLNRLDQAKTAFAQWMAKPGGVSVIPPHPPELASRAIGAMQAVGWRPSLASDRAAI
jgi:TolB-like protein/tetratricopeptide (TPR) repeat protein